MQLSRCPSFPCSMAAHMAQDLPDVYLDMVCLQLSQSLPGAFQVLDSLRMRIDWDKSCIWGLLLQQGQECFPPEVQVQLVTSVRELGVLLQVWGSLGCCCAQGPGFQSSISRRPKGLERQPRPLLKKAATVQSAVWPSCLCGSEARSQRRFVLLPLPPLLGPLRLPALFSPVFFSHTWCLDRSCAGPRCLLL